MKILRVTHQEEEVEDCEGNQQVVKVALETAPASVGDLLVKWISINLIRAGSQDSLI